MSTQYITIKKSDQAYLQYLWGHFSDSQVALPVKSYNLGTDEESITFEIKHKNELNNPSVLYFIFSLIKIRSFVIIYFPFIYVGLSQLNIPTFNWVSFLFAALAAGILFSGVNIRNDVNDHVSGYDRVNHDTHNRPIGLGWITAKKASKISLNLVVLAATIALPCFFYNPELLILLSLTVFLIFIGRLIKNNSYKNQRFGEVILFVLVGPALVSGVQLSTGLMVNLETLLFGIIWGLGVVYLIQINNFTHIMTSSQNGIRNTMTRLGFDLAQKFLIFWWVVFLIFWFVFQVINKNSVVGWVGSFVLVSYSIIFFKNLLNIKSPMGSGLKKIKNKAYGLFIVVLLTLFLQGLEPMQVLTLAP